MSIKKKTFLFIVCLGLVGIVGSIFFVINSKEDENCLSLEMIDRSSMIIPKEAPSPCSDRIITDINGIRLAKDQVDVILYLETLDPEDRIREIVLSTGGVIVGSVPELLIYQVWYDVSDLDALDEISTQIKSMPDVKNAGPSIMISFP